MSFPHLRAHPGLQSQQPLTGPQTHVSRGLGLCLACESAALPTKLSPSRCSLKRGKGKAEAGRDRCRGRPCCSCRCRCSSSQALASRGQQRPCEVVSDCSPVGLLWRLPPRLPLSHLPQPLRVPGLHAQASPARPSLPTSGRSLLQEAAGGLHGTQTFHPAPRINHNE